LLKREQGQKPEGSGDGNDEEVGGVYEMVPDAKQV